MIWASAILTCCIFSIGFIAGASWASGRDAKIREHNRTLAKKCKRLERSVAQYYGPKARKLVDDAV